MPVMSESSPLLANTKASEATDVPKEKLCRNLRKCLSSVTVEPAIFFYALSYGLESVFSTNLYIDKICKDSYSPEVCKNLDSGQHPQQQDDVQRRTNDFNVYIRLIEYVPGVFSVLLLGAWSDFRDRKVPILVSLLGLLWKGLGLTAMCYWWNLPASFLLAAYIPVGFTGSVLGFYGALYAYVSVISDDRSRTSRVGFISIILHVFQPCGQVFAELIFDSGGYVAVFGTYTLFVAVAFAYCLMRLDRLSSTHAENGIASVCSTFSPSHLKKTLLVAFKERKFGRRGDIIGHISVVALYVFARDTKNYQFLFCRKTFSWEHDRYTFWSTIDLTISAAGQLLLLPVLSYVFQVEDALLGFTGAVSLFFCYILRGTAFKPWIFYLSSAIGLCMEMISASSRAALSKLVWKDELGAIFSILSSAEAIIPTVAPSIYTAVYNSTLDVFPGSIFIVAAGFVLIVMFILVWILTRRIGEGIREEENNPQGGRHEKNTEEPCKATATTT